MGAWELSEDQLHKLGDLFLVCHPIEVVHVPPVLDPVEAFIVQDKERRTSPANLSLLLLVLSWCLKERDTRSLETQMLSLRTGWDATVLALASRLAGAVTPRPTVGRGRGR